MGSRHNSQTPRYIGIEIGGSKLQLVVGDGQGVISARERFQINPHQGASEIRHRIEEILPRLKADYGPGAIGVGFGGPVDWQTGDICCSHHVEGWSEFKLGSWLSDRSGLPVKVDNDGNTAALGEATHGAGSGLNPVFYVTLGSGVGGGLVVDGKIYHGAKPGESEIGHTRLDRNGTIVENRCSGWAVDRRVRNLIEQKPGGLLANLVGSETRGEARFLAQALAQNDADANQLLEDVAEDLAFALSHVVHLQHPEVIVIGGGLSLLGEPLRSAAEARLPRFVMEALHPPPAVKLAEQGEDAVPIGALVLASEKN